MKYRFIISGISILVTGTMLYGYMSKTENLKNYASKIQSAQSDLVSAQESIARTRLDAYQQLNKESAGILNANEKRILELKTIIAKKKYGNKEIYLVKLHQMEQKNDELNARLLDPKKEEQDTWLDFNNDISNLTRDLRNFKVSDKE
jgi:hypothetical protein